MVVAFCVGETVKPYHRYELCYIAQRSCSLNVNRTTYLDHFCADPAECGVDPIVCGKGDGQFQNCNTTSFPFETCFRHVMEVICPISIIWKHALKTLM